MPPPPFCGGGGNINFFWNKKILTHNLLLWEAILTRLFSSSFLVRFVIPIFSSTLARPDVSGDYKKKVTEYRWGCLFSSCMHISSSWLRTPRIFFCTLNNTLCDSTSYICNWLLKKIVGDKGQQLEGPCNFRLEVSTIRGATGYNCWDSLELWWQYETIKSN